MTLNLLVQGRTDMLAATGFRHGLPTRFEDVQLQAGTVLKMLCVGGDHGEVEIEGACCKLSVDVTDRPPDGAKVSSQLAVGIGATVVKIENSDPWQHVIFETSKPFFGSRRAVSSSKKLRNDKDASKLPFRLDSLNPGQIVWTGSPAQRLGDRVGVKEIAQSNPGNSRLALR